MTIFTILVPHQQHDVKMPKPPAVSAAAVEVKTPPKEVYDGSWPSANYDVHVFYYAWYGNPAHDRRWYHWNHRYGYITVYV